MPMSLCTRSEETMIDPNRAAHIPANVTRRDLLFRAGAGFGALALSALLEEEARAASPARVEKVDPLAPRPPQSKATARSVIWLFMEGGPSHIDLFDPKPALEKIAGKPMPESFGHPITAMGTSNNTLMPSKRT